MIDDRYIRDSSNIVFKAVMNAVSMIQAVRERMLLCMPASLHHLSQP